MAFIAVIFLFSGIFIGSIFKDASFITSLPAYSKYVLYLLIFTAGFSIGMCKSIFSQLKAYKFKVLVYPLSVIVFSLIGGALCSLIPSFLGLRDSLAVSAGLCWYSLSSTLVAALSTNASAAIICFMANLIRELLCFMLIPVLSKRFGGGAGIAMSGATAQDSALIYIVKYSGEQIAVLSVISGIVCSFFIPIIIRLVYLI